MTAPFSAEEIAAESIKPEEYQEIVKRLSRHPNKAELGMFGVMWSEQCSPSFLKWYNLFFNSIAIGNQIGETPPKKAWVE